MRAFGKDTLWSVLATVQYATAVTVLGFVLLTIVSLPAGLGFVGVKIGLFLLGVLTMGYATYLAWPTSPADLEQEGSDPTRRTRFQQLVYGFPPVSWKGSHPERAVPDWVKVYAGSAMLFGWSYVMEAVFGVVA